MQEVLDCNKNPIKVGYIVYVNIKKEDGTIDYLIVGEVKRIDNDPSLTLCVMMDLTMDYKICCTIPPEHVSVFMPSKIDPEDDKMINNPESFPAYPLEKYPW